MKYCNSEHIGFISTLVCYNIPIRIAWGDPMKKRKLITIAICLLLPALASCSLLEEKGITANNEQSQLKETEQKAIVQKIANNYYYQQLNKKQQDNYIKLYQSLSQFREVISLSSQSKKSLIKTIDAFVMDNPEFFWITSADYHFEISDYDAYVTFPIPKDIKTTYQKLQSTADEIVSKMPQGSDYDKVKYFYEVIVQQTDYIKKPLRPISQVIPLKSPLIKTFAVSF